MEQQDRTVSGRPQEVSRELIDVIVTLHKSGYSMHKIARTLNSLEVSTPRKGKRWHASNVKHVLDNYLEI